MPEPWIVVAGSADASRTDYRPPVDIDGARRAARKLGVALAQARNSIVVYHRAFIEGDVVAGYATVPDAPERGIVVRYPLTDPAAARNSGGGAPARGVSGSMTRMVWSATTGCRRQPCVRSS